MIIIRDNNSSKIVLNEAFDGLAGWYLYEQYVNCNKRIQFHYKLTIITKLVSF